MEMRLVSAVYWMVHICSIFMMITVALKKVSSLLKTNRICKNNLIFIFYKNIIYSYYLTGRYLPVFFIFSNKNRVLS
jgi:hypothetical protein